MDDRNNYILPAKVEVKAAAAANQLIDFAGKFHAAEAGTDNDEAQVPAPAIGITSRLGMLHLVDDMLAKVNGIAHNLETKRMVGHSGDDPQVGLGATGNHDVVVMQARQRTGSIVKFNLRSAKVNPLHALRATPNTRQHLAQRGGRGVGIDRSTRDIREQWVKHQMILAVEKKNLALRSRQFFTKRFCELYGRKSASDDNNSYGLHSIAPMTRLVDFHFSWMQSVSTRRKKHFRFAPKHRNEARLRISKMCEFYWNAVGAQLPSHSL
jgi:hypothetical protein